MRKPRHERGVLSAALLLAALIAMAAALGGRGLIGAIALTVVVVPLGLGLHEVVHLAVGAAVGLEVQEIRVGSGPPLIERTVRHVHVTVGSAFDTGVTTFADPIRRPKRWKMATDAVGAPTC